ncbi:MAG: DUF4292 domain-containing protein [Bacteroidia bacterium]|nr:DUF4292 domain-containing protein [Bacteroidia bacterium]MDW8416111.1 DUF4292 domain-containing protein [Bacteroidia bacterium]
MERATLIFSVLWLLIGCPRAAKEASKPKLTPSVRSDADAIVAELRKRYALPQGVTFRLKYQALYEGERRQPFQLRLIGRDSMLWLSAGLMGFEGIRAWWQSDSLVILNRLSREAYVGRVDSLRSLFPPLRAADLLALLIGRWGPCLDSVSWRWFPEESTLRGQFSSYHLEAHLADNQTLTQWRLTTMTDTFLLKYDYTGTASSVFPVKVTLTLSDESRLLLTLKEVEQGKDTPEASISIPDGYIAKPLSEFRP